MKGYWHVCTDGLEKGLIFKDKDDFIFGMNGVPVCALRHGVYVLAFCLMDNHVHFILTGDEFSCRNFILSYKRRLFSLADLDGVDVCMKKIEDKEYLLKAIAYVLRNPLTSRQRIYCLIFTGGAQGLSVLAENAQVAAAGSLQWLMWVSEGCVVYSVPISYFPGTIG